MMERNIKKNVYMYITVTLLCSRSYHNIINQLYFNLKNNPNSDATFSLKIYQIFLSQNANLHHISA